MRHVATLDPAAWEAYALAFLGAAAVLLGLIFVGLSINLERLLRAPWLFRRASAAILQLMAVFVASAVLLVPDQPTTVLGLELTTVGLVGALLLAWLLLRRRDEVQPRYRRLSDGAAAMGMVALLLFAVAGLAVLVESFGGLYWIVPASLLCVVRAMLDSWVLLVEVNR
jgi:hypothetical protein